MDTTGHLSASQLTSFAECGERFRLERVEKVRQAPAWWNIGGRSIHLTFDEVVKDKLSADDAAQRFVDHFGVETAIELQNWPDQSTWRKAGRATKANPNKEDAEWWLASGPDQCRKFATEYDTPFLPGRVVEVDGVPLTEIEFNIPIGEHMVKGFIDAVVELPDGRFVPRDYKAGSKNVTNGLQVAIYAEALRQLYNVTPTVGEYLMTRKMIINQVPLGVYTADLLAHQFDTLQRAKAADIFLPNTNAFCGSCGVATSCAFGGKDAVDE